jgi:hypothetical protein
METYAYASCRVKHNVIQLQALESDDIRFESTRLKAKLKSIIKQQARLGAARLGLASDGKTQTNNEHKK